MLTDADETSNTAAAIKAINDGTYTVKYAVSVYGIEEDEYYVSEDSNGNVTTATAGLTFGPASGFSFTSQYASHEPSGYTEEGARSTGSATIDGETVSTTEGEVSAHRCIHDDSWEMIIWWSEHNPYVYEQCLSGGTIYDAETGEAVTSSNNSESYTGLYTSCTKAVELTLNSTISSGTSYSFSGDGTSSLFSSVASEYYMWNSYDSSGSSSTSEGWDESQIRQVLNGEDTAWSYAWHDSSGTSFTEINEDTALISCFPEKLQEVIVKKVVGYNTCGVSDSSTDYLETSYDKLWLFTQIEMSYNSSTNKAEGSTYSRNDQDHLYITNSTSADTDKTSGTSYRNILYMELDTASSTCAWYYSWLRSLNNAGLVWVIDFDDGETNGSHASVLNTCGLAPGFCLP